MPLQIVQARNDLLSKLGIEDASVATQLMLQDVAVALNGALQTLQGAGQDYFTREIVTGTFAAGSTVIPLGSTIQTVIGPVEVTSGPNIGQVLSALQSEGEYSQYARIYGDSDDFPIPAGEPVAYWVENLRSGTAGDIVQINLRPVPVPTSSRTFRIEVVKDAPAYGVADLTSTNYLPVAQSYAEAILLPIARLNITRSSQFGRPDLLRSIEQDARVAYERLGMSGGFPQVASPQPPRATIG